MSYNREEGENDGRLSGNFEKEPREAGIKSKQAGKTAGRDTDIYQ